jgi:hypothetical protein
MRRRNPFWPARGEQRTRLKYFMINSTVIYLFSYLIVYLLNQLISFGIARYLGITGNFYYYEIYFTVNDSWSVINALAVSNVGIFLLFFLGIIVLRWLDVSEGVPPYQRMFWLWFSFHCLNLLLGGIIAGSFSRLGLGYLMDFLFWPQLFIYLALMIVAAVFLVLVGMSGTVNFLRTSPSLYWVKPENFNTYLVHTALYPCLFNAGLLFLIKFPDHNTQHEYTQLHDLILSLTLLLIVLPMLFRRKPYELAVIISVKERDRKIHRRFLITTLVILLLFRLCLNEFFFSLF